MPGDEDIYAIWRDLLHEMPEAEEALGAWRKKQVLEPAHRRAQANRLDILTSATGACRSQMAANPRANLAKPSCRKIVH
jgi:hypothetical protein